LGGGADGGAMQLRAMETLLQVTKEKNTIILFPGNFMPNN
jgi:hypothetical protein